MNTSNSSNTSSNMYLGKRTALAAVFRCYRKPKSKMPALTQCTGAQFHAPSWLESLRARPAKLRGASLLFAARALRQDTPHRYERVHQIKLVRVCKCLRLCVRVCACVSVVVSESVSTSSIFPRLSGWSSFQAEWIVTGGSSLSSWTARKQNKTLWTAPPPLLRRDALESPPPLLRHRLDLFPGDAERIQDHLKVALHGIRKAEEHIDMVAPALQIQWVDWRAWWLAR